MAGVVRNANGAVAQPAEYREHHRVLQAIDGKLTAARRLPRIEEIEFSRLTELIILIYNFTILIERRRGIAT